MYGIIPYIIETGESPMPATVQRTARIEARISPDALKVIRRAAEIQGRSVSDFVVAATQAAAEQTVADVEILRLSRKAQERFAKLLIHPPAPTPALARAFKRHRALIAE
jgi:uncharacterized protein (DUF1778 family)